MPVWTAENDLKVELNCKLFDASVTDLIPSLQLATAIIALHQVKVNKGDCDRLAAIIGDGELKSMLAKVMR